MMSTSAPLASATDKAGNIYLHTQQHRNPMIIASASIKTQALTVTMSNCFENEQKQTEAGRTACLCCCPDISRAFAIEGRESETGATDETFFQTHSKLAGDALALDTNHSFRA
jgi:hypothetical protein